MLKLSSVHAASPFSSAISSVTSHSLTCIPHATLNFLLEAALIYTSPLRGEGGIYLGCVLQRGQ